MADKKPDKKVVKISAELATSGMVSGMYDAYKPEELADYCIAVAKRIIAAEIDSD